MENDSEIYWSGQGVNAVFKIPIARYDNKDLTGELKKYILSKNLKQSESTVAPHQKQNIVESNFNFFNDDIEIVQKTAQWIVECVGKTVNFIQSDGSGDISYKIIFNDSWYHITKTNGIHEIHMHAGCSWCGVYYVDSGDEKKGGDTVFRNPVQSTYADVGSLYLNNISQHRVEAEDGKLILFPSLLNHYQSLYEGTKDRIVIAFNASVWPRESGQLQQTKLGIGLD